ncbi:hypothetical protein Tco_1253358 [Tanacetum coccineum]
MVAYLKKPEGSEGFHQIVDFLNASHIRYALTENPTIYVSLIKQFWETATAKTLDNGEIELTATTDGKVKIVTEASVRRHLQLADSDGISSLPTTKIFEQLFLMGRTNRHESVVPQPRSPTQTPVADEAASTGVDVRYGGATTTVTGLEAGHGSGQYDTPRIDGFMYNIVKEGGELRDRLEADKLNMVLLLILSYKKGKKLRGKDLRSSQARRRAKIIVFDDEDDLEDPSKQGRKIAEIDQDLPFHCTAEKDVRTAKPVTTASVAVSTVKEKGKAKMD